MASVNFSTRGKKNSIVLDLSLNTKNRLRCSTGFSTDNDTWKQTKQKKGGTPEAQRLRTRLKELSEQVINSLVDEPSPTIDWLQAQINQFRGIVVETDTNSLLNNIQNYVEVLPSKKMRYGKIGATYTSIQKYKALKNKIELYEKFSNHKYLVSDVSPTWIKDFEKWMYKTEKLNTNTAGRYIKFLKTVCTYAGANDIEIDKNLASVKGYSESRTPVFLSFDELELIENTTFEREALNNAKDWLLIGCYLGQRVSDLLKLTKKNFKTIAGMEMISLKQQKTGKSVMIPIHSVVKTILDKNNGFPYKISDQRFNEYVKDVCKLAGIIEPVKGGKMVTDKVSKKTRKQFAVFPKWELVSSHICRRSFASNYYGDIPTSILKDITAHSTEAQFLQYIGKSQTNSALQLAEYWSKQQANANKQPQMTLLRTGTED
jgi:integrase